MDPFELCELEVLRTALAEADSLLEDVLADLEGPYEMRHPKLFRRIREWREDSSDSGLV